MDATKRNEMVTHLAGPLALAAFAAAYNSTAHRLGKPTISAGVRWTAKQKVGTEIAGAIAGGLLAHWFLKVVHAE
jgi:hypothetical protein